MYIVGIMNHQLGVVEQWFTSYEKLVEYHIKTLKWDEKQVAMATIKTAKLN